MFNDFFVSQAPAIAMSGIYVPHLVFLSYIIASFGSYTGLMLASDYRQAQSAALRGVMLLGGAFAFGCAIWSMHYIGMRAYEMDMPMRHTVGLTVLSMVIAIAIALGFFVLATNKKLGVSKLAGGAFLMGSAICGMHYTGMASMDMPGTTLYYLRAPFVASIVIAMGASGAALWIFLRLEAINCSSIKGWLQALAALVMGAAICGMHYMGMAAAVFVPDTAFCIAPSGKADGIESYAVAAVTGMILAISISTKIFRNSRGFFQGSADCIAFPIRIFTVSLSLTAIFTLVHFSDEFMEIMDNANNVGMTDMAPILGVPVLIACWSFTLVALRRWQKDLDSALAAADKANAAKSEFLANMSHDLRTPMNGIIGLTRLLAEGRLYPEQAEMINSVLKSSETLLLLLNDILDLSKLEAGQLTLDEAPCNLKDTLQDIVTLLSPIASKKGISLDFSYCDMAPACVVGDGMRISQIVTNLIGNALKFTEQGHVRVEVRAEPAAESDAYLYRIVVTDTGIGIDAVTQKMLFKKFSQGDASINRKYGGTGLGLVITRRLAEKMSGEIHLQSELGRGTCITATLLLKAATAQQVKTQQVLSLRGQTTPSENNFSGYKVLLVDDHPVNRLFAKRLLEKMGFNDITVAEDGTQALRCVKEARPSFDIVLMDCQMPELDGLETTRRIREMEASSGSRHLPVIAMTAHAMSGDRENCLQAGMDDYVSKPINPQILVAALKKQIDAADKTTADKSTADASGATVTDKTVIDLEYLGLFTEGDRAMEKMMADVFICAGIETLDEMRSHFKSQTSNHDWKKAAHKLKGSAGQIGAAALASVCLVAETGHGAEKIQKEKMFEEIEKKFAEVQSFFNARA